MSAKFYCSNPDGIMFKLELDMSLAEWRKIKVEMGPDTVGGPVFLSHAIRDMIAQAEKEFAPHDKMLKARIMDRIAEKA